jgi:hypothetical protein
MTLPTCQPVSASTEVNKPVTVALQCSGQGPLSYSIRSNPANGILRDLDPAGGTVTYDPAAGFTGHDNFSYTASNPGGPAADQTVTVDITPSPPPSNAFIIGKARRNPRKGTALLPVKVPGPGTLGLTGRGVKRSSAETVNAAAALKVAATGALKRRLRRRGHAQVSVAVTYTPLGGSPSTTTTSLKLQLRR